MKNLIPLFVLSLPAYLLASSLASAQLSVEEVHDVEIIEWHDAAEECPLFVARKASVVCEGTEAHCTYNDGELIALVSRTKVGRRFRYLVNVPTACLMAYERGR